MIICPAPPTAKYYVPGCTAQDLKKLLVKVVDHNELDANGDTPVHSYVRRRDKEKFKCLMTMLIHGDCDVNMPNKDGQTALHLACEVKRCR